MENYQISEKFTCRKKTLRFSPLLSSPEDLLSFLASLSLSLLPDQPTAHRIGCIVTLYYYRTCSVAVPEQLSERPVTLYVPIAVPATCRTCRTAHNALRAMHNAVVPCPAYAAHHNFCALRVGRVRSSKCTLGCFLTHLVTFFSPPPLSLSQEEEKLLHSPPCSSLPPSSDTGGKRTSLNGGTSSCRLS